MNSGMRVLFLVLLYDDRAYRTESCSSIFTNLDASVNVDHSTNVGEVVYTLMNGNDTRSIEIETSGSGIYGLNPSNDHEVIVTACVFWIGSELVQFKFSGDSTWCGRVNFVSSPAIPQFTNPTKIIKIGAISPMEFVDVVQVTFANDKCAYFECHSLTCINDPSQNFVYTGTQVIGITNFNIQYGVTYTIETTCRDIKHSSGTTTQNMTVVFYETAPTTTTTTTTISTASSTESSNTTTTTQTNTPTTSTTTHTSTTTAPSTSSAMLTTPTNQSTTSMASPTTTTATPIATTIMYKTTTTHSITTISPLTTTTPPSTSTAKPTTTTTTSSTTTTIPTTALINPSTALTSFTTTVPTSTLTLAIHTTISATPISQQSGSTTALAAGIEVSDPETTKVVAIVTGAAIGGVGLLGLIAFSLYWKLAGTKRISPRPGRESED